MLKPLIIELDEQLASGEQWIDTKTIVIEVGSSKLLGHLAVIKKDNDHLNIRYGNLKAYQYDKKNFGNKVI